MKKIFIILLLVVPAFKTVAQDATKQETMDWIAEKLRKHLQSNDDVRRSFYFYNTGKFSYTIYDKADDGETGCGSRIITIDLNKLTGYTGYFVITGNNMITENKTLSTCEYNGSPFEKNKLDIVDSDGPFNISNETGLVERMKKAVEHLIKFNNRNPNEKF
jgi:hypothetical protein